MTTPAHVAAIIVAAGSGKRFGGAISKQFVPIGEFPLLYYTLQHFQTCAAIEKIWIVAPADQVHDLEISIRRSWGMYKLQSVIAGGAERHDSVWAGLNALSDSVAWVAIHDGARPLVSAELIERTVLAAKQHGAALPGLTPRNTIKIRDGACVKQTLDRNQLVSVQTPQVFARSLIVRAYSKAYAEQQFATDDAALVERLGETVWIVEGDTRNIKVTCPDDLDFVKSFLL